MNRKNKIKLSLVALIMLTSSITVFTSKSLATDDINKIKDTKNLKLEGMELQTQEESSETQINLETKVYDSKNIGINVFIENADQVANLNSISFKVDFDVNQLELKNFSNSDSTYYKWDVSYDEQTNYVTLTKNNNTVEDENILTTINFSVKSAEGLYGNSKINITNIKINDTLPIPDSSIECAMLYIVKEYDPETNSVFVIAYSDAYFTNVSTENWYQISIDGIPEGKVIAKQFKTNGMESTSFELGTGEVRNETYNITEVLTPTLNISRQYDEITDTLKLIVKSNVKMTNSKVSATSGWTLSEDGLTYTKEYKENTNYNTTFTFVDETTKILNIVVYEIKKSETIVPKLSELVEYYSTKNTATVLVRSNVPMINSKVLEESGWILSEDGLTYKKEYLVNTNYYTTFKFVNGTEQTFNIIVTVIKVAEPFLTQESVYDEATNTVKVTVASNIKMIKSEDLEESGWKLSEDGLTYTKVYVSNKNEIIEMKFENGAEKRVNIIVTGIKVIQPVIKQESVYDETTNIVKVTVTSNVPMTNSKVSAASGWKLSEDKLTYTKEYAVNTNYYTTFKFEDGTEQKLNIIVTGIKVIQPVIKQESVYDETTNTVKVTVTSDTKMIKSEDLEESGWKLSEDGLAYTKVYTSNKTGSIEIKFENGTEQTLSIAVTSIKEKTLTVTNEYDATTNTVKVVVTSNVPMTDSKVSAASGWKLSEDKLTYTKEYAANTNYYTTFKFADGTEQRVNIIVTEIQTIVPTLKQEVTYDETTNTAKVIVTSNVPMTNSKVSAASGWKLSEDKLTYTKEYAVNTNYYTTFKFADGTEQKLNIIVTGIKVIQPVIKQESLYDEITNTVKVTITSDTKMIKSEDLEESGWKLSEDGLTYTKVYTSNKTGSIEIKFENGTEQKLSIAVTSIKEKTLTVTNEYDATTNTVKVVVTSNVPMTDSKVSAVSGWKLSEDKLTYTKEYAVNTNYYTTFEFVDETAKRINIVVTEIQTIIPTLKQEVTYDETTNTAKVTVTSNVPMTNSKVSAASGWKLSEDKLTYTKEYAVNTNYYTTFKFADGTEQKLNIIVTGIKVIQPVIKQESLYDEITNTVKVTITSDTKMIKSEDLEESEWKLSEDGLTYTKVYTSNKTGSIEIKFENGTEQKLSIAVTSIKEKTLTVTNEYDATTNTVKVVVTSNVPMTDSKVSAVSGWKLSEDKLTYTKEYAVNTNYYTTFEFADETAKRINIVVTEIQTIIPTLKQEVTYDETTNTAKVTVTSNVPMTNSKVSAASGWKLSEDKLTYTKEYAVNTNYYTTFKFADGTEQKLNIIVTGIKVIQPVVKQESVYDETTNTVKVTITSDTKMIKSEDLEESGWKLSEDGLTYTKVYTSNKTGSIEIKFENGTEQKLSIAVTSIKEKTLTVTNEYDATTNTVKVVVTSNVPMTDSKVSAVSGWKLSEDKLTYEKEYAVNTNYYTTFKFTDGTEKRVNIVVTEIQTVVPTLKQEVTYDEEMNTATVIITSNVPMTNSKALSDPAWKLSEDGLTYTKKYLLETDYETTFTFIDGTSQKVHIVVNGLLNRILTQDQEYDPITQTVTVYIRAMDTKILKPSEAGWIEVSKNLTYKKVFTANTEYDLTVSYVNGLTKTFHIRVNELPEGRLQVEYKYDIANNRVIVNVKSSVKMTNSKVSADSGWKLSEDGMTYTKMFSNYINYNTTFTFEDGQTQTINLVIESYWDKQSL